MTIDIRENKPLILVADDDDASRILLRAAISQWHYPVIEAVDGMQAWEILNRPNSPQIVILDWLMPRLDGISLCHKVKNEMKKGPYIILLTQISGTSNIIKAIDAGADEFLAKPFNHAELRSRILVGHRIVSYEKMIREMLEKDNDELLDKQLDNVRSMSNHLLDKSRIDLKTIIKELNSIFELIASLENTTSNVNDVNNNTAKSIETIKNIVNHNIELLILINQELMKYK